ncbi:MAG: DUF1624 domain-containing protein [Anaerolineae bacterium]
MTSPQAMPASSQRLWEVDSLRGFAIVEMVFYHFVWDLSFFGLTGATLVVGPWQWFARSIATLFIFTMGVSLTLSYHRELRQGRDRLFGKYLVRGLKIFGWGMVITVATYFFIGRGFVIFGILHLLGVSVVLAYPFLGLNRWVSLAAGIGIIIAGILVDPLRSDSAWLVWLGVKQTGSYMVDYYPVLPWSGIALIGVFVGHTFYPGGRRTFSLPDWGQLAPLAGLQFLGRHSLLIYLVHQPVIIGLFLLLGFGP